MKKHCYFRVLFWVLLVCFVLNIVTFVISTTIPFSLWGKSGKGIPFYFYDPKQHWSQITDIAVCGDYLYLLYDTKSIVQCYDTDGNYQCSYRFAFPQNGTTELLTVGGNLYVKSSDQDLYEFSGLSFVRYYNRKTNKSEIEHIRNNAKLEESKGSSNNGQYELRGVSVWFVNEDGIAEMIVHRSALLGLFQARRTIVFHVLLLPIVCFLYKKYMV